MRLIDADKLYARALPYFTDPTEDNFEMFDVVRVEDIKNAPTIDPVKHGHWMIREDTQYHYECCHCKCLHRYKDNYCPLCGAKMDEPNETK